MILDKPIAGSEIGEYVEERSVYWGECRQLTRNELVSIFSEQYRNIQVFCEKNDSQKALQKHLKSIVEQKHSVYNLSILSVVATKIVAEDVLAHLEGKAYFPDDDWVRQFSWIARAKVIETIRVRDVLPKVREEKKTKVIVQPEPQKPLTVVRRYFRNPFSSVKTQ